MSQLSFSERLLAFMKRRGLKNRHVAELLGVTPPYISQILSGEREKPSKTLLLLFARLEAEASDPFISGCERILSSNNEEIVQGFVVNVYAVLDQVDGAQKEAEHLRQITPDYLRARKKRARDAG